MDQGKPLLEISREMQVSPDRVRYWAKLIEADIKKQGHTCFLSSEVVNQIAAMDNLIKNGLSPKEASRRIKKTENIKSMELQPNITQPVTVDLSPILMKLESMEKGMMFMAEKIAGLEKENRSLRFQLMPSQESITPVIPWQPETAKDPLEGMTWFQQVYVKMFEPQKLRRYDS